MSGKRLFLSQLCSQKIEKKKLLSLNIHYPLSTKLEKNKELNIL